MLRMHGKSWKYRSGPSVPLFRAGCLLRQNLGKEKRRATSQNEPVCLLMFTASSGLQCPALSSKLQALLSQTDLAVLSSLSDCRLTYLACFLYLHLKIIAMVITSGLVSPTVHFCTALWCCLQAQLVTIPFPLVRNPLLSRPGASNNIKLFSIHLYS